jgi:multidrug efflux pump subunit AcrB
VKRLIDWFVHNGVAANLLMMGMVVGGLVAAPQIPHKIFPDVEFGIVTVDVPYLGAAPEEVEQGVCVPIEEAIESVVGVETIRTTAAEGNCRIRVDLFRDADADVATADIRNRVDGIRNLPEQAERPVVAKYESRRPVVDVALSGDVDERVLKTLGRRLRDEIAALEGVTQADLFYDRPYEISIEVPEESLRRHGLSFDQLVRAVRRSSLDLPGGSIKAAGGEILLRGKGRAYRGREFEGIVVLSRADGTRVTLGEIGRVVDGFEEIDLSARFDGKPAVMVRALRVGHEDVIEISDVIRAYVEKARARMPEGVDLTIWQDGSQILRGRLETLYRNGRNGLLLVFAVLALFLRFRLAIWVSLGVPIALLGALMTVPLFGVSIDQASLFAFILVLGILVDDAIVVGENIYTHEGRLGERVRASIEGTREVAVPVVFGVFTTVAAFSPLLFLPGYMGQVLFFIGTTVIACLLYSLVESQLVLPSHLSHGRSKLGAAQAPPSRNPVRRRWDGFQDRFALGLQRFVEERYRPFLRQVMHWRYLSVSTGIGLLMLTGGILGSGRIPFTFFPPVEADYVAGQLVMTQGVPISTTLEGVARLETAAEQLVRELDPDLAAPGRGLVRHRLVSLGRHAFRARNRGSGVSGGHVGEVVLELVPAEDRALSTGEIAQRWRELTGEIPGAKDLTFAMDIFSVGSPIDLQLRGPSEVPLTEVAAALKQKLATYPGLIDIADTFVLGKREIQLEILPEAEPLGLSMEDLARQVRQAFYGEEAQRIQRGRDDVRVMVRYPEAQRRSLADLENMRIRSADGAEVPFSGVARARFERGYADIQRTNRQRVVNVVANVDRSRITSNEVLADLRETFFPELFERYPGLSIVSEGEQEDQQKAFAGLLRGYPVALLAIFALLAIPLRSYLQPLIIMSVIPFGAVGAVAGHLLLGRTFSFPSVIGFVALSGVVVNASLMLVVTVNRHRAEGRSVREAVELAGAGRFRPIVLTAVTTFAGLTPLMLEGSLQAQSLIPMAVSLAFGVVFATAITLILVPCGYVILEDLMRRGRRPRGAGPRPVARTVGTRHEAA